MTCNFFSSNTLQKFYKRKGKNMQIYYDISKLFIYDVSDVLHITDVSDVLQTIIC